MFLNAWAMLILLSLLIAAFVGATVFQTGIIIGFSKNYVHFQTREIKGCVWNK